MFIANLKAAAVAAVAIGAMGGGVAAVRAAQEAAVAATSREGISTKDLEKLHELIRPGPGESRWLTAGIPWTRNVTEARRRAAAEGKPLFIALPGGAGYADLLGPC